MTAKEFIIQEDLKPVQASKLEKGDVFLREGEWFYVTDTNVMSSQGKMCIGCRPVVDLQYLLPTTAWVRIDKEK